LNGEALLTSKKEGDRLLLVAGGEWTAIHAHELERLIDAHTQAGGQKTVDVDMTRLRRLDTFGAWLIERLQRSLKAKGSQTNLIGLRDDYKGLLEEIHRVNLKPAPPPRRSNTIIEMLQAIGRSVVEFGRSGLLIAQMVGELMTVTMRVIAHPSRFRLTSTVNQVDHVGWRGVPIVLLIMFLIGCILAQQGIFHFRKFGADIFVIDMIGILVLREVGVLIVCIMVAGRSGSAYTAELGSMKMREETDALRTMGFDPIEVLILPRIVALVIAVPLLTFLGSMAALYGGGLVCWIYGGIDPEVFLSRLKESISIQTFEVGMIKAPFMALVIGIVACVEGLQVKGSAESLGIRTTASVVKSIFLVIVLDGLFAMFFASIGM
jgi:phospholipid/cholesterol/gamma-HCH transport system permease protein